MKRALIVDDSKTARIRLRKMLERYDLEVDFAMSAEEALGYLSYRMPAVIFMDHHMEGMDGFEALKIIKANPNTAMIPVVMYTAQKGDVYVGQARALGALDILSKETFKPSNLDSLMVRLGVQPANQPAGNAKQTKIDPPAVAPAGENKLPDGTNINDESLQLIRAQVARLFEIHIADVRNQITENTRFIVRRLGSEFKKMMETEPTVGDIPLSVINAEAAAERSKSSIIANSFLVLIVLGLVFLAYQQYALQERMERLTEQSIALQGSYQTQADQMARAVELMTTAPPTTNRGMNDRVLISMMMWALDTDLTFDYNEPPLSEEQILKLNNFIYKLASAGFSGNVYINIHFGNFCLQQRADGTWIPAEEDTPLAECIFTEDLKSDFQTNEYLSLAYMNFEQNVPSISRNAIEVHLDTSGLASPRRDYPSIDAAINAKVWNNVARENNRLSLSFQSF